ncbi:hypothetical protein O9992_14955 [Vibrio lentus]|nr:hypothetical protein [Vibrio lentus]
MSLGTTAGALIVGVDRTDVLLSLWTKIEEPGLVSDIFLMMFMYAIGMKVGPQFFSGLARGGIDFVVIGLIVVFSNFAMLSSAPSSWALRRLCRGHHFWRLHGDGGNGRSAVSN